MNRLHQSRCLNHPDREAVARCPECGNFFCRECVTEHSGKLICSACLASTASSNNEEKKTVLQSGIEHLTPLLKFIIGFFVLWITFYAAGRLFLLIPDSFHSGDIWEAI